MCLMNYSLQHDFIMLLLPICLSPPSEITKITFILYNSEFEGPSSGGVA